MSLKFTSVSGLTGFGGYAGDPHFAKVVLLASFDGSDGATEFSDESPSNHGAFTFIENAQLDTSQSRFGGSSALFDGTGDRLDLPDSTDWDIGAGQFTVECHARFVTDNNDLLVGQFGWTTTQQAWGLLAGGGLLRFYYRNSVDTLISRDVSFSFNMNEWNHFAVDRDASNVIRVYFNGEVKVEVTDGTVFKLRNQVMSIGHRGPTTEPGNSDLDGWIGQVRITKDVARYAGSFTSPTSPYPRF